MTEKHPTPDYSKTRARDPFTFEVAHRRLAWCFRLSVFTNITLALSLTATVSALVMAYPLKETRFAFLRADSETNTVYRVEPVSTEVDGFKLFIETKAKAFVENILPVDQVTQNARYLAAFAMATDGFKEKFAEERFKSGWLKDAHGQGLNRSIIVENAFVRDNSLTANYLVTVDFIQIDRFGLDDAERRTRLSVNLEMAANPQWVEVNELYENPLGIVVLGMSVSVRP